MTGKQSFNRTIWMLWLQGWDDAPPLAKACLESWRVRNPGWQVKTLSAADLDDLWTSDQEREVVAKMPASALSNMARSKLLLRDGGVWADATLACSIPLDIWTPTVFAGGFFAYADSPGFRPIDNFFMISGAENPLLNRWYQVCLNIWSQASVTSRDPVELCGQYAHRVEKEGKLWTASKFWRDIETVPYYWHHYIFDLLLHREKAFADYWGNVPKITSRIAIAFELREAFDAAKVSDEEFDAMLRNSMAPTHKLNWRRMDPDTNPRVKALLDHCCGRT